jgi:hypothetical protein
LNPISPVANSWCNHLNIGVVLSLGAKMRRRDFIKVVAGSAITWPLAGARCADLLLIDHA